MKIESMSIEGKKFKPSKEFVSKSYFKSMSEYNRLYDQSIKNPNKFWAEQAKELEWFKKWKNVSSWDNKKIVCKWFEGGKINVSYNCLDRHVHSWRKNKAAIIWIAEDGEEKTFTYEQLLNEVCKFSNVLKKKGIKKGDRICIYMPMVPELAIAMLACTRIGAIHSIVFGGFSAESLKDRIHDSNAKLLITSDGSFRRGKIISLKKNADFAIRACKCLSSIIVVKRTGDVTKLGKKETWWHEDMQSVNSDCKPEHMDSEDPLFILYTSGTTGKPKGVLHTTAGYLLYAHLTFKWIFDYREEDTYWCTADLGWITGHSYIVYGPLSNGATSIMFEGVPDYPKPDRAWEIIEKHKVNIFYTAPTAIRALSRYGDKWPKKHDLSSLRLLGSVGEPINPDAWMWYYKNIGNKKCPIVDTWWQTETGGILITPIPGAMSLKPGSACKPFFGVRPSILKEDGSRSKKNEGGYLVIEKPWPGMMRTIYGDQKRFKETYFSKFPGIYLTGDGAKVDKDGYYWIMGRLDDVINVSGHRIGTAEVESALVSHKAVAEAAVVPMPHKIKGQALYAFVILKKGNKKTNSLKLDLIKHVGKEIGHIAKPDGLQFADSLPKTRSGKIMRRILKAIAEGKKDVGDITTLADSSVVKSLLIERKKLR